MTTCKRTSIVQSKLFLRLYSQWNVSFDVSLFFMILQRIKHQILREYRDNLRDTKYRETKRRFQHLHEKLAHIKRLVLEWDTAQSCRS